MFNLVFVIFASQVLWHIFKQSFFKSFRLKVSSTVKSISSFHTRLSYTCVTCHLIFWQPRLFLKPAFQEELLLELERKLPKCQVMYSSLNLLQLKCLNYIATCLVLDQMFLLLPGRRCETNQSINIDQLGSIFAISDFSSCVCIGICTKHWLLKST